ncbi:MAG: hypothetical protein F6J93_24765 [Oscillatoria sp. SIO1A7]|nr:hypothetical protein [Oscillatoria sp. SIO1A7]
MSEKNPGAALNSASNIGAASLGAASARTSAAATDALMDGMDSFRVAAAKLGAVDPKISQGNLFEYIEAAKFNADAAQKGSSLEAVVTAERGQPHAAADILIREKNRVVGEVQAKSGSKAVNLSDSLAREKYRGMQKLVPDRKAESVRELSRKRAGLGGAKAEDYADTAKNVSDQLRSRNVSSGGTSYEEALWAAKNPELYATIAEAKYLAKEAAATGANAAVAGFVVAGAIAAAKNGIDFLQNRTTAERAIAETAKDAAGSAMRGGATGAASALLRYGFTKIGAKVLLESNAPVAVAAGIIDIGASVYSFATGELAAEELIEIAGQTGTCTAYSLYAGTAGGAVFGPVGAAIGSVAGYLLAAGLYQSAAAIFKEARLTEEQAKKVIAILGASREAMADRRVEFERVFEERFNIAKFEFFSVLDAIDVAIGSGCPESAARALGDFATLSKQKLPFATFEEFDDFMNDNSSSLVL